MSNWIVITGAVGAVCCVASLVGVTIASAREGDWPVVVVGIGALATILFLTLVGIEFADDFWKGRS